MVVDGQPALSKPPWKQRWLDLAEVIDSLRVFPRWLAISYWVFTGWETSYVTVWYAHLAAVERTVEVTAFYSMLMGGLFGLAAYVFKVYSDGGRDWDKYRADTFNQNLPDRGQRHDSPGVPDVGGLPRASG